MKLNLGCGTDIREGYVNVDFRQTHPSVVNVDLSKLPWPFEDESADEILMLDFLEHFPYSQTNSILIECHRVLTPSGSITIQVPDASILCNVILGMAHQCNRCGYWINRDEPGWEHTLALDACYRCGQPTDDCQDAAVMRLYGGQDHPGNFHQTCFTKRSLVRKAETVGLIAIADEDIDHQAANWNFKMKFKKGDIW